MSVGVVEVAFLLAVTIGARVAVTRTKQRWIGAIPLFFLFATLISPADIASTLLIGLPNCVLFVIIVRRYASRSVNGSDAAA